MVYEKATIKVKKNHIKREQPIEKIYTFAVF